MTSISIKTSILTLLICTGLSTSSFASDLVFVKEYCTYAKNFENKPGDVASIDVSTCHLLEIYNKDDQGKKTAFSLTHFTQGGLTFPKVIEKSVKVILDNFERIGGDISTAEFRIYGGTYNPLKRGALRGQLIDAITKQCGECSTRVQQPSGHFMKGPQQAADYIFSVDDLTWRRVIELKDESKDQFSKNLRTRKDKENYQARLDKSYMPIQRLLDAQTNNMIQSISIEDGNPDLVVNVVGDDGIIQRMKVDERKKEL